MDSSCPKLSLSLTTDCIDDSSTVTIDHPSRTGFSPRPHKLYSSSAEIWPSLCSRTSSDIPRTSSLKFKTMHGMKVFSFPYQQKINGYFLLSRILQAMIFVACKFKAECILLQQACGRCDNPVSLYYKMLCTISDQVEYNGCKGAWNYQRMQVYHSTKGSRCYMHYQRTMFRPHFLFCKEWLFRWSFCWELELVLEC